MQNFQVTFETCKQLFISAFSICITVTLTSILDIVQQNRRPSSSSRKKWSFPLRISSVNVTKSSGNCGSGHIYWRNPLWKTSFSVQWLPMAMHLKTTFMLNLFFLRVHNKKENQPPHFWSMFPFHTSREHQKTKGLLVFLEGYKWKHWSEMVIVKTSASSLLSISCEAIPIQNMFFVLICNISWAPKGLP